jgi:hypothetical protein
LIKNSSLELVHENYSTNERALKLLGAGDIQLAAPFSEEQHSMLEISGAWLICKSNRAEGDYSLNNL